MKQYMMTLLLALVAPAMSAGIDARPGAERNVADSIEIQTLPNGEIVTRLVSRNGLTARQFWMDSVYQSSRSIVVFQGHGGLTQIPIVAQGGLTGERWISRNDRVLDDTPDFQRPGSDMYAGHDEDKVRSQLAEARQ